MIQTTLHSTDFVDLEDMYADNFEEKKMRKKFRGKNWKKVTAILLAVCAMMSSVPKTARPTRQVRPIMRFRRLRIAEIR